MQANKIYSIYSIYKRRLSKKDWTSNFTCSCLDLKQPAMDLWPRQRLLRQNIDRTETTPACQGSGLWAIGACETQPRSKIADFDLGTCANARVRLTRWTPLPVANADNSRRLLFYHNANSTDASRVSFLEVTRFWPKSNSPLAHLTVLVSLSAVIDEDIPLPVPSLHPHCFCRTGLNLTPS